MGTFKMPKPGSGGFAGRLNKKPKSVIRIYPYAGADGEMTIAEEEHNHFVTNGKVRCTGAGCAVCADWKATKNKDIERKTCYMMALVDVQDHPDEVRMYEVPTTVYRSFHSVMTEAGDDADGVIGDDGKDFVITYDISAKPMYTVQLSVKTPAKLSAFNPYELSEVGLNLPKDEPAPAPAPKAATPKAAPAQKPVDKRVAAPVASKAPAVAPAAAQASEADGACWALIGGVAVQVRDTKRTRDNKPIVEVNGRLQLVSAVFATEQEATDAVPF